MNYHRLLRRTCAKLYSETLFSEKENHNFKTQPVLKKPVSIQSKNLEQDQKMILKEVIKIITEINNNFKKSCYKNPTACSLIKSAEQTNLWQV